MNEPRFWPLLVLAVLATWRITHLLVREDGPADLLFRLRKRLGHGFAGRLMDCFYCMSVWVAALFALVIAAGFLDWLLVWLALSGAACLLERLGSEPVVIQPFTEHKEGEHDYGLLRTSSNGAPTHSAGTLNNQNSAPERASASSS